MSHRDILRVLRLAVICLGLAATANGADAWKDPSPHRAQQIVVDKDVALEVLDWGGRGRTLVLLAGGGNTAHTYDDFAPKLIGRFHVVGITRRGIGASSIPASGYGADRLADDIVAVLDQLKIDRPVLVGHSVASEEMNALVKRHQQRIAGLVYLDAAYDRTSWPNSEARQDIVRTIPPPPPPGPAELKNYKAYSAWFNTARGYVSPEAETRRCCDWADDGTFISRRDLGASNAAGAAIVQGVIKPDYASIRIPALAIYGTLRSKRDLPAYREEFADAYQKWYEVETLNKQTNIAAFQAGVAHGRVVELPGANHYVFASNEADVIRELNRFMDSPP